MKFLDWVNGVGSSLNLILQIIFIYELVMG